MGAVRYAYEAKALSENKAINVHSGYASCEKHKK